MSSTMTIRLDELANATHRTKSFLAAEAIHNYDVLNEWQIHEVQDAIKEADAGDFANDEDVNNLFDKRMKQVATELNIEILE